VLARGDREIDRMALLLMGLMLVQSLAGLLLSDQYRDVDWIKATWFGNDWITLAAAVPLLWVALLHRGRESVRGRLVVLGIAGYAVYNYAFYLFGAALNRFFPLYAVSLLLGILTLGRVLAHLDVTVVANSFRRDTPVRLVDGYLVFVAAALAAVWLGIWGAYAFAGRPTPIKPEAFKIVAALDLTLMVPTLAVGGVMLWRRRSWGYVIATIAATQSALYLLVLSVNSAIAIRRGLVSGSGELPIWGPLTISTTIAAILLLSCASGTSESAPHGVKT
jgi:hypothetical protein